MNLKKCFIGFLLYFFALEGLIANAYNDVKIEGLFRFSEDSVLSNLKYNDKTKINEDELSEEIKNIYSSGLFSDVSADYQNGKLKLKVVEVPVIAGIKFNGLKNFKKDMIMPELSTKERGFYSKATVISDARKLEMIYKSYGILDAVIEPMIEFLDGGKIYVIFNIKEGKSKKISNISIDGNKAFFDYTLKEQMAIKEKAFYRIFSSSPVYNVSKTASELERLKLFYLQKGYAKMKLDYSIVSIKEENLVDINIFITEGLKYKFGNFEIVNNVKSAKNINPQELIEFKADKTYNINLIEKTKYNIKKVLAKQGFIFSEIAVDYKFNDETQVVDVVFSINPTRRIYVDKIKIIGNLKTEDKVIRRELLVSEGDVYDVEKVRRSIQRLNGLGIFSKVNFKENPTAEDRVEILISIIEGRTLTADVQLAYDFSSDFTASVSLSEENFLGKGISSQISVSKGRYSEGIDFSIIEPYLFDRDLTGVWGVGYASDNNKNLQTYKSQSIYMNTKGIYTLYDYLRHGISYKIKNEKLEILNPLTLLSNPLSAEQNGTFLTSAVGHVLTYDRRDNRGLPNNGYLVEFAQDFAGLGGDVHHISHAIRLEQYFEMFNIDNSVLGLKFRAKNINGIGGKRVPIQDRLKLGSAFGLRGFDFVGVSPKFEYFSLLSKTSETFNYGGKNLVLANIEYRFPNFLPAEFGFITFAFFDAGTVFGYEPFVENALTKDRYRILDSKMIRTSAGVGISWSSPIGIIAVSYAHPLRFKEYDETKRFFLSIGGMTF